MDQTPPMTTGEVAAMFAVTPETVAAWADAGKLASFRTPGGHRRFLRTDVELVLEASREAEAS